MKSIITLVICSVFLVGNTFPELKGKTLNGTEITLPIDASDKLSLIGMAYSKKSEGSLKSWFTPLYDKFILKRGIFDSQYDINLYFVPMFTGLKKSAYEGAYKKLQESNRNTLFDNIIFYKGDLEPYKSELGLKEKSTPYLFLVDQNGSIIHRIEGPYTEGKLEKLEDVISEY